MNKKLIFCFVCLILACFTGTEAKAEPDEYIVYLKKDNVSYSKTDKNCVKEYEVCDKETLEAYLESGIVEYYEPNYEVKLYEDFSLRGASSWNLNAINVSKAWDIGCYGNDVTVAVIDSGAYAHPDLADNLLTGYNYVSKNTNTNDNIGHGTYVSGIIAANMNGKYIDGVASRVKIVPLKCFDKYKSTNIDMLADAVYDAVNVYHADVINMSLGMEESFTSDLFKNRIEYAVANGCIVVAAVGNDGTDMIYYPANYNNVIGVGSVNSSLNVSGFSQRNSTVDVVAPGDDVSSVSISGYSDNSGTSFAAPHVSAMAAIAKCIKKDITAQEFEALLRETSTDLGERDYDTSYGYGLINIEAMIDKMLENTPVFMSPADGKGENITVTVYNNNNSALRAKAIAAKYENSIFKGVNISDLYILPHETAKISREKGNVKFMILNSFTDLCPLYTPSEYIFVSGG